MQPTLTIHIGSRKTGTTWIQRALGLNEHRLAAVGIHLPTTGRFTLNPGHISHHHLGFELDGDPRFDPTIGGWEELAEELVRREPDHVLLSCEMFERLIVEGGLVEGFLSRVRTISTRVRLVLVVRDWFSFSNSMYNQFIKMFERSDTFSSYLRESLGAGHAQLARACRPLVEADDVDLHVLSYADLQDPDPLSRLLAAADLPIPGQLDLPRERVNTSLGAIGLEVTTVLGKYLTARHDDWAWHSRPAQQLHVESLLETTRRGWNEHPYWGWEPRLLEEYATHVMAAQDEFADLVWGTPWLGTWPLERPPVVSHFQDYPPALLDEALEHIQAMDRRYIHLRDERA